MPGRSAVRDWVDDLDARSFFAPSDVPGPRRAVESALSRMVADHDAPIVRVRQGLYWRKPPVTRFGAGHPDPVAAVVAMTGPGSGPSGVSAANLLGLSTQVPATPVLAIVGRAPKGMSGVRIVTRANLDRRDLNPTEVAALEVLRDYPTGIEADWPAVRSRLRSLIADGQVDHDRLARVGRRERKAGMHDRLASVVA